jgi:hypothetical protein
MILGFGHLRPNRPPTMPPIGPTGPPTPRVSMSTTAAATGQMVVIGFVELRSYADAALI